MAKKTTKPNKKNAPKKRPCRFGGFCYFQKDRSLPQPPTPATPPRRRGRTARIANPITKDISEHYKSRGIGPEKTAKIEAALKEGVDVAVIADTVGVSKPTIYIIKTRMRESGQLK